MCSEIQGNGCCYLVRLAKKALCLIKPAILVVVINKKVNKHNIREFVSYIELQISYKNQVKSMT